MSMKKYLAGVLLAAAIPATAEAQRGTTGQRVPPPVVTGRAVPRAGPTVVPRDQIPQHVRSGVRMGGRSFSANLEYYNFNGRRFAGYVSFGNFYPFGFGPTPLFCPPIRLPYDVIVDAQWANIYRPYPPIGAGYAIANPGFGRGGVPIPAPTETGDVITNNYYITNNYGTDKEDIQKIIEEAEKRGYDRATRESDRPPAQPPVPVDPPVPREPILQPDPPVTSTPIAETRALNEFHSQYDQEICDSQKKGYITAYLNEMFGTLGNIVDQRRPFSAFMGNVPAIHIRDTSGRIVDSINSSQYMGRRITTSQLRESVYNEVQALHPRMAEAKNTLKVVSGTYNCR